jgi:hypothetical protein
MQLFRRVELELGWLLSGRESILKIYDEYNTSLTDSHSFLVQFSTFGYMLPNMCLVLVLKIS